MNLVSQVLLNAVVVVSASQAVDVRRSRSFTFYIKAANIVSGGTMKIQAKTPAGDWTDLDSRTINANGDTVISLEGAYTEIRANLSARTDGTFTVSFDAQ